MGNKFIPLEERNRILKTISEIRSDYKIKNQHIGSENSFFEIDYIAIAAYIASLLGAILSVFGAVSLKWKNEIDKQTEIDFAGDLGASSSSDAAASYYEFERMVGSTLSEAGFKNVESECNIDLDIDFSVKQNDSDYYVCVKKYKRLLGMSSLIPFLHTIRASGKNGIFVISSGATQRVIHTIDEFNSNNTHQTLHLVIGDSKELIKSQLLSIANTGASNK